MHHDRIALGEFETRGSHLVAVYVILQLDLQTCQAFSLDSQQHDYIGAADRVFKMARKANSGRQRGSHFGQKLGRSTQNYLRAQLGQQVNGAARHAAVIDIANDGYLQSLEIFLVPLDGVGVEQGLRRMLMHSVAGIDYRDVEVGRHQMRSARIRVADDNRVRAHRAQSVSGVQQRLAFFYAGTTGLYQCGDRAQRLGCDFKRSSSAGGGLVEQKDHALAAQQETRFEGIHAPRQLQHREYFEGLQMLDAKQRTARSLHRGVSWRSISMTRSSASTSCSRTSMISRSVVCTFRPI